MDKNIFIKGDRINLRPLALSDIDGPYQYWFNNPEIVKFNSHGRFPMTLDKLKSFVASQQVTTSSIVLAIIDVVSSKHIGNISLQNINWVDRNAEIAFILGEKDFWGKGIMKEAGKLMLDHAFETLNMHRVYCGTSSDNMGMQKLAIKLGMKEEGIRKEAIFNQGKYFDILEYGVLNRNNK